MHRSAGSASGETTDGAIAALCTGSLLATASPASQAPSELSSYLTRNPLKDSRSSQAGARGAARLLVPAARMPPREPGSRLVAVAEPLPPKRKLIAMAPPWSPRLPLGCQSSRPRSSQLGGACGPASEAAHRHPAAIQSPRGRASVGSFDWPFADSHYSLSGLRRAYAKPCFLPGASLHQITLIDSWRAIGPVMSLLVLVDRTAHCGSRLKPTRGTRPSGP